MTKAKFEIGETEKHTIIVNASALLKYIKIEVDGEKVVNEANFQPFSMHQKNVDIDLRLEKSFNSRYLGFFHAPEPILA